MPMSKMLEAYLMEREIGYAVMRHPHTASSMDTAAVAHVPGDRLAKGVVVKDGDEYLMVVVPSDYHVHLGRLHLYLGHAAELASEQELKDLFPDCESGAVPPIGAAFGRRTLIDRQLLEQPEIFFESGDHETLIRVGGEQLDVLLDEAEPVDVGVHL
ncbi:aminoacyl-tRNA deacylase [Thiocystis violascens]|uniref:YbaK/aminoacyl-tRNA synthetase-associated domain-containing protein n=1 Tax=Thiocystis violascens (strain ATCC 17096 / DSM 198 / 6111) TaxID=765911 RepID=I3Y5M6_THIV6|nr:YbaK/EbsC family protein [Thiocystis violascens]AFL72294.1 hypothetical protein Thivi_0224 [Thiocystis violascens DSM 198]